MTDPTLQAYYDAHTLQAYYDAHDRMMDCERGRAVMWWPLNYGDYKVARYNAAKAGLIPEQPQFDVGGGQ